MKLVPEKGTIAPKVGTDFAAFAVANHRKHGPKCSVCKLPPDVLKFISLQKDAGHPCTLIGEYLQSKGYHTNGKRIAYHFRDGHGG